MITQILDRLDIRSERRMSIELSMRACHVNGCPLDLEAMLNAEREFDVVHDVYGIDRHTSRETGRLQDCFWPRFAKQQ